jgi:predicted small secreted protein
MRKIITLAGIGLIFALAGCNTMQGAGKDMESGGEAISNQAQETQRTM